LVVSVIDRYIDFCPVGREVVSIGRFFDTIGDESDRTICEPSLHTATVHGAGRVETSSVEADIGNTVVWGQIAVDSGGVWYASNPAFSPIASIGIDDAGKEGWEIGVSD
jgi:hypothetical protein